MSHKAGLGVVGFLGEKTTVYYCSISAAQRIGRVVDLCTSAVADKKIDLPSFRIWLTAILSLGLSLDTESISVEVGVSASRIAVDICFRSQTKLAAEHFNELKLFCDELLVSTYLKTTRTGVTGVFDWKSPGEKVAGAAKRVQFDIFDDEKIADSAFAIDYVEIGDLPEPEVVLSSSDAVAPSGSRLLVETAVEAEKREKTGFAGQIGDLLAQKMTPEELTQVLTPKSGAEFGKEQLAALIQSKITPEEIAAILREGAPEHAARLLENVVPEPRLEAALEQNLSPSEREELKATLNLEKTAETALSDPEKASTLAKVDPELVVGILKRKMKPAELEQLVLDSLSAEEKARAIAQSMHPDQLFGMLDAALSVEEKARALMEHDPAAAGRALKRKMPEEEVVQLIQGSLSSTEKARALSAAAPKQTAEVLIAGMAPEEMRELLQSGLSQDELARTVVSGIGEKELVRVLRGVKNDNEIVEIILSGMPEAELVRVIKGAMPKEELTQIIRAGASAPDLARRFLRGIQEDEVAELVAAWEAKSDSLPPPGEEPKTPLEISQARKLETNLRTIQFCQTKITQLETRIQESEQEKTQALLDGKRSLLQKLAKLQAQTLALKHERETKNPFPAAELTIDEAQKSLDAKVEELKAAVPDGPARLRVSALLGEIMKVRQDLRLAHDRSLESLKKARGEFKAKELTLQMEIRKATEQASQRQRQLDRVTENTAKDQEKLKEARAEVVALKRTQTELQKGLEHAMRKQGELEGEIARLLKQGGVRANSIEAEAAQSEAGSDPALQAKLSATEAELADVKARLKEKTVQELTYRTTLRRLEEQVKKLTTALETSKKAS